MSVPYVPAQRKNSIDVYYTGYWLLFVELLVLSLLLLILPECCAAAAAVTNEC